MGLDQILLALYYLSIMTQHLQTKELIIAVVDNDDAILMRKKPLGSLPYTETWYLFGCERIQSQDDIKTMKEYLKSVVGIDVDIETGSISSERETKQDHDGVTKIFAYTNLLCHYLGGAPRVPSGALKIEWIPKDKLAEYDLVPPSVKLLKTMGYMK